MVRHPIRLGIKGPETAIREYVDIHDEDPAPIAWIKSADQLLASIARCAQRTLTAWPY
jgi:hypothetical protein